MAARRSLLFLLVPMWGTFAVQRLVLHHSHPDTHVFVAGYLVHHLFSGVLVLIPTAFLLAFGTRKAWSRDLARAALGFSSSMVLDEVVYLVCTDGSGTAYRGAVSFAGALVLLLLATAVAGALYLRARRYDAG
jgi:hypothetical protein